MTRSEIGSFQQLAAIGGNTRQNPCDPAVNRRVVRLRSPAIDVHLLGELRRDLAEASRPAGSGGREAKAGWFESSLRSESFQGSFPGTSVTGHSGPLRQDSCRALLHVGPVGRGSDDDVTRPFSLAYKQKMLDRLTGKDAVSARQLALETGLRQLTLSRWLQDACTSR